MNAKTHRRRSGYFWMMLFLLVVLALGLMLLVTGLIYGSPPFPLTVTL